MTDRATARGQTERGAALLGVLILVAVIGALAAGLFDRLRLATHLAGNAGGQAGAHDLASSAETLLLARIDSGTALPGTMTLALPGGAASATASATATLDSGSSCFNLNSLVVGRPGRTLPRLAGVAHFARLLVALDIASDVAARLAAASADWIDSDDVPLPGGAEDDAYARASPAYRTGGTAMVDASEWRAVAGVTPAVYARVRPLLCALPVTDPAPIDIDTLTRAEAPLLAALLGRPLAVARAAMAARPAGGWRDPAALLRSPALAGTPLAAEAVAQLVTVSPWRRATLAITAADTRLTQSMLVDARQIPARLVARRWSVDE